MRVLLLLNGEEGWQTGIEDGFLYLKENRLIKELKWFYFQAYSIDFGMKQTLTEIYKIASNYQPQIVIFFHIEKIPITPKYIRSLKDTTSKPIIVYDEGDMYGGLAKPISKTLKIIYREADIVSIRGLGDFYNRVKKYNNRIIYTPHHADIARFDSEPFILEKRDYPIVLIGNNAKSRIPIYNLIFRMPGSKEREKFVECLGEQFGNKFNLWGNRWGKAVGNHGSVHFQKQLNIYRNSWITVAYEHYPDIPYYFSNRLPIALLAGSLYVCHYHKGYENIFMNCDFIFYFKTNNEAIDIINFILSLDKKELIERSIRAREFAIKYFTPKVIWARFYENIIANINSNDIE